MKSDSQYKKCTNFNNNSTVNNWKSAGKTPCVFSVCDRMIIMECIFLFLFFLFCSCQSKTHVKQNDHKGINNITHKHIISIILPSVHWLLTRDRSLAHHAHRRIGGATFDGFKPEINCTKAYFSAKQTSPNAQFWPAKLFWDNSLNLHQVQIFDKAGCFLVCAYLIITCSRQSLR